MTVWLKQSTAATVKLGPFVDDTDGKTAETGLTISQADVRLSKNGGDMAQKTESTSCTHDELGYYDCPLDTTDTGTLGRLRVMVAESGALPVWQDFHVVPANVWDSMFGADYLKTEVVEMSPAVEGGGATAEAIRIEMDSNSTRLASIDGKLASTTVTVQSPVASSGAITVHTGDDYDATHGRALEVTVDDVPDLTDATVKLKCSEATWTGSVAAGDGTAWVISFEPTAAETAVLTKRTQAYEIEATLSDSDVVTLATGTLSAVRDIPEVV